jgi:DNA-binding NtrC family response regulator
VGKSEPMGQIFGQIDEVSGININVFIGGESGTGEELVAKAINFNSTYKTEKFIALILVLSLKRCREMNFSVTKRGPLPGHMIPVRAS